MVNSENPFSPQMGISRLAVTTPIGRDLVRGAPVRAYSFHSEHFCILDGRRMVTQTERAGAAKRTRARSIPDGMEGQQAIKSCYDGRLSRRAYAHRERQPLHWRTNARAISEANYF